VYDSLETFILANGEAAVELSFRSEIDRVAPTGEAYLACGHIDKMVRLNNKLKPLDRKTTKHTLNNSYFARYSPDNQVSFYSYFGKVIFGEDVEGMIIDAAQILVNDTQFQRGIIDRKDSALSEWISDFHYYISLAELAAQRNYWPMNDKACSIPRANEATGEIEYGCPFRTVCGAAPEIRATLLKLNYDKRVWDPLQPR
jgi:hypothetical protein